MDNPKMSIVAVNWWAKDFARVLINSLIKNTKEKNFEILIIDNSQQIYNGELCSEFKGCEVVSRWTEDNLGHGAGLDLGVKEARGEYVLILDIDAHILLDGWDEMFVSEFGKDDNLRLLTASDGGLLKPARPLAMFFKRETIINNNISFKAVNFAGVKFDVGLHAYFRILTEYGDKSVKRLVARKTDYKDVLGNEYCFDGKPFVYHNWYGTRWYDVHGKRVHDKIDKIEWERFEKCKKNLFKQIKNVNFEKK